MPPLNLPADAIEAAAKVAAAEYWHVWQRALGNPRTAIDPDRHWEEQVGDEERDILRAVTRASITAFLRNWL